MKLIFSIANDVAKVEVTMLYAKECISVMIRSRFTYQEEPTTR